jgi:hypothetical protein
VLAGCLRNQGAGVAGRPVISACFRRILRKSKEEDEVRTFSASADPNVISERYAYA